MAPGKRLEGERALRRWRILRQRLLQDPLRRASYRAERARLVAALEAAERERERRS